MLYSKFKHSLGASYPPWKVIFPFAVWNVWKSRNNLVFNGKSRNPKLALVIVNQALEFFLLPFLSKVADLECYDED